MKTKLLTLLAIGLCGLCLVVVSMSCSRPSTAPSATPSSTAVKQAILPPGLFGPAVDGNTKITIDNLNATAPVIPSDLYRPPDGPDHKQAAIFAWLEFIALASPNKPSPTRGVPGGPFSSVKGGTPSAIPLVFETYQHRSELFPYNGNGGVTRPQPWDQTPKYQSTSNPTVPSGVDYTLFNNLDEASQIFQNNLFFPNAGDPSNPFEVLFEAKGNQMENQYLTKNYPLPVPSPMKNPTTNLANLYDNTIEIKVAWRPVESIDPAQLYRYHVANVITYSAGPTEDSPPVVQNKQYALIALHIIHKTNNYPSFVFATFEQVDQLVNQVTNQPTGVYFQTLYDQDDPPPNPPPGYQFGSYYFTVDASGYSATGTTPGPSSFTATTNPTRMFDVSNPLAWPGGTQTSFTPPPLVSTAGKNVPVVLPTTPNPDVASVNAQVKQLMNSLGKDFVWQYYQLTGVQAIPSSDETTSDYYLANIVVESSQAGIQLFRGGLSTDPSFEPVPNIRNKFNVNDQATNQKYSMGGCMGCHGAAQGFGGDFSFLLVTSKKGFSVDTTTTTLDAAIKNARARRALIRQAGTAY
jgi:hypothetical protein